ncbi:mitochondrial ribosome-associated GTPase 2-like protein [Leptotrombidium deliense]|uniref:Mitochondrial ribosome-associated GTPase 2-like protein n=1 Tax=Leptotrombidium deliense TaxID=299467 RepID=A0A443SVL4_9ACAR|nr:mitochondrial ribosome-associated GTPase 2-like protein [Leptotrombidium deliense]
MSFVCGFRLLSQSLAKKQLKAVRRCFSQFGTESDSERWRRIIADRESGHTSAFEDEDGNVIVPTGSLTNATPLRYYKEKSEIERDRHFVDWARIRCTGGNGGDGCISFLHLPNNPLAGPDGGDGGNGGHVILEANSQIKSLANVKSLYRGERGIHGMGKDMFGKSGEHTVVLVPVGTLVKKETGETVADLDIHGSKFLAARGGAGGKGNHFYLSNKNRHPAIAEVGARGEENVWVLEMKTVANAGLVGFPNAGKSTLLQAISRAKPKVASYPFTTLNPFIGIVHYDDFVQLAVADLPGLIPDAHKNKGLGISFLKHLERCVCLMYVIDLSVPKPWEQLECLKYELEMYKQGLSKRPHVIVGNKYDLEESKKNLEPLKDYIARNTPEGEIPLPVIPVSGKYGENIVEFLNHLRGLYDLYNKPETTEEGFVW